MENTRKLLGSRIKELRKARKVSQNSLSEKIHIDPKHLSRIEVGRSFPSLDTLEKIAAALQIELKDFFEFTHPATDSETIKVIKKLLMEADTEKLQLIMRIVKVIVR